MLSTALFRRHAVSYLRRAASSSWHDILPVRHRATVLFVVSLGHDMAVLLLEQKLGSGLRGDRNNQNILKIEYKLGSGLKGGHK